MSIYCYGSNLTWDQYLQTNTFIQDADGVIRKDGESTPYVLSDRVKKIVANEAALAQVFPQAFDGENSTLEEGFGIIGKPAEIFAQGMEQIGIAFEYGMGLLIEQVAIKSPARDKFVEQVDAFRQTAASPSLAQARQLYNLGREQFQSGVLTDALNSFLKAKGKNDNDFLTLYDLGYLYLYGKNANNNVVNLPEAEKHLRNAAWAAKMMLEEVPEARTLCVEAFFHAAVACCVQAIGAYQQGNVAESQRLSQEASDMAKQATEIFPEFIEGFYQHAKASVVIGETQQAIQSLEKVVQADWKYCIKIDLDRDFDSIRSEVLDLFKKFYQDAKKNARNTLNNIEELLDGYVFVTRHGYKLKATVDDLTKKAENCQQRGTYLDFLNMPDLYGQIKEIIDTALPQALLAIFQGHTDNIRTITFSADKRYLASGSSDRTVRLWAVPSGEEVRVLEGHTSTVYSVSFSPDGEHLLSRSPDGSMRIWDIASGQEVVNLYGEVGYFHSSSFSPDGQYLAAGSSDYTVHLWQPWGRGEGNIKILRGHKGKVLSVVFSRDGQYVASGSSDNTIQLWEVPAGRPVQTLRGHKSSIYSVSFSPDGTMLASGSDDNTVRLWEIPSGKSISLFKGHRKAVGSVSFSPNGRYLASRGLDNSVRLWDVASGEEITIFEGQMISVYSISFSPRGKFLAIGTWDNTVRLWDVALKEEVATFRGRCVSFSRDGQYLAAGSRDGSIRLWGKPVLPKQEFETLGTYTWQEEEPEEVEEVELRIGFCSECGAKLSFFDKLRGYTECRNCRSK